MQRLRNDLCLYCCVQLRHYGQKQSVRSKSTSSAINRGLSATSDFTRRSRERSSSRPTRATKSYKDGVSKSVSTIISKRQSPITRQQQISPDHATSSPRITPSDRHSKDPDAGDDSQIPLSVPHTTAASRFIYGANVVLAALRAQRRKLYQLYILSRSAGEGPPHSPASIKKQRPMDRTDFDLSGLARAAKVPIQYKRSPALLDRMSDGRPHNGVVLEASTIPAPPVLGLGRPDHRKGIIPLTLDRQSAEDVAVNGAPEALPTNVEQWRYPFVVMLDGITDPENVGSIIRSCHFYGVDAVAIATNTCATLSSPVLAKASSGACEAVNLLALPRPSEFVYESAKAGWEIHAAVAPTPAHIPPASHEVSRQRTTTAISAASPLAQKPCILILGSEGQGLRENLRRRANYFVTIERAPSPSATPDVGVDSMNVGVAAGVLLEAFMRKPASAPEKKDTTSDLGW